MADNSKKTEKENKKENNDMEKACSEIDNEIKKIEKNIATIKSEMDYCVKDYKSELEKIHISESTTEELRKNLLCIKIIVLILIIFLLGLSVCTTFLFDKYPSPCTTFSFDKCPSPCTASSLDKCPPFCTAFFFNKCLSSFPPDKINWLALIPVLCFTLITGFLLAFIQKIEQHKFKKMKPVLLAYFVVLAISLALSVMFSFIFDERIVFVIIIVASFIVLFFIFSRVLFPFMPEEIKNGFDEEKSKIIELLDKLRKNKEELFRNEISFSHAKIEKKIDELIKDELIKNDEKPLSNKETLNAYFKK
jgi:cation transport ATPase